MHHRAAAQFARRAYIEATQRYGCTWLTAVPPMIAMMLRSGNCSSAADLSGVEFLRMGSAPVSASLMAPAAMPAQAQVTNAYGTTEPGRWCSVRTREEFRNLSFRSAIRIPQVQIRLVDDGTNGIRACWR